jgi:hypothetical protein
LNRWLWLYGSRLVFADFMGFFGNIDRFQYYYFHNRNYSQYAALILSGVKILNGLKGLFFQSILG